MHTPTVTIPSAADLLQVWEEQQGAHPVRQVLAALAITTPGRDAQAWALATVGERDRRLLDLHEHLFGSALSTLARCPQCGERLESDFCVDDVRYRADAAPAQPLSIELAGYQIDYRLPTSADLLALGDDTRADRSTDTRTGDAADSRAGDATNDSAARRLLQRCISRVQREGGGVEGVEGAGEIGPLHAVDVASLPDELIASVCVDMARHDPHADVSIGLECPTCGAAWQSRFDIMGFF